MYTEAPLYGMNTYLGWYAFLMNWLFYHEMSLLLVILSMLKTTFLDINRATPFFL